MKKLIIFMIVFYILQVTVGKGIVNFARDTGDMRQAQLESVLEQAGK